MHRMEYRYESNPRPRPDYLYKGCIYIIANGGFNEKGKPVNHEEETAPLNYRKFFYFTQTNYVGIHHLDYL